jgi:hypothetical protein
MFWYLCVIREEEIIDLINVIINCMVLRIKRLIKASLFSKNFLEIRVIDSYQYTYDLNEMSISQRQSIITLLPKPEKDTKYLKNWRPISLLNIDYKLMTKCLAFRLKKVLPNIIHSDQTGFMRGRYIGDNIRNILEIIETVEEEDLSCIILSVDFDKAFDSLSWKFLHNIQERNGSPIF